VDAHTAIFILGNLPRARRTHFLGAALAPYLQVKRGQSDLALTFYGEGEFDRGRAIPEGERLRRLGIRDAIRRLNYGDLNVR